MNTSQYQRANAVTRMATDQFDRSSVYTSRPLTECMPVMEALVRETPTDQLSLALLRNTLGMGAFTALIGAMDSTVVGSRVDVEYMLKQFLRVPGLDMTLRIRTSPQTAVAYRVHITRRPDQWAVIEMLHQGNYVYIYTVNMRTGVYTEGVCV